MGAARIAPAAEWFAGWVKETGGANRGRWVEAFQRIGNGQKGDAWCAHFVTAICDMAYTGRSPLPPTGSCDVMLAAARKVGTELTAPRRPHRGDLFFVMRQIGPSTWHDTDAIHVGVVTGASRGSDGVARVATIEGNTNTGGGREGWGCLARTRDVTRALVFIRLPRTT